MGSQRGAAEAVLVALRFAALLAVVVVRARAQSVGRAMAIESAKVSWVPAWRASDRSKWFPCKLCRAP